MIGPLGTQELLLLFLIIALLFGARKLPELGKGVGEAIRNFRGAMKTASEDDGKDEGSSNAS
ncbi:MAG: twin-arginine translocase TatA/TatE family subunit [Acidobacteria bacterium]|nr:MAG: twin-arginine translocase TatA/TatE family subunit [Acidobacteriota bacterium]